MSRSFTSHKPKAGRPLPKPVALRKAEANAPEPSATEGRPKEIGGPKGPEPTRYGDWERKGVCVDF